MNWIFIGETTRISGRYFLFGQCYTFTGTIDKLVDCDTKCYSQPVKQTIMKHYIVELNDIAYHIPFVVATEIPEPIEAHDMPRIEAAYRDFIDKTPNMVAEWEKATGIYIGARKSIEQIEYANEVKYKSFIEAIRLRDERTTEEERQRVLGLGNNDSSKEEKI